MVKLKKKTCYALVYSHNGNKKPIVNIEGIFKTKKQAENYLKWLNPDNDKYSIKKTERYIYEKEKKH